MIEKIIDATYTAEKQEETVPPCDNAVVIVAATYKKEITLEDGDELSDIDTENLEEGSIAVDGSSTYTWNGTQWVESGGGGNLPTPSSANYGDSLVVGKQSARGAAIVPKQTVTTEVSGDGSFAVITGDPTFVDGNQYIITVNGTDYVGTYLDWEITIADPTDPDLNMIDIWYEDSTWYFWINDEAGDYTIQVSEVSYQYAYVTDPYAAYDVVISTSASPLSSNLSDYIAEKYDYDAICQKVLNGELITGILYIHYNYDDNVDGDTDVATIPLNKINIYSNSADMFFAVSVPVNIVNNGAVTMKFSSVVFGLDVSTGSFLSVVARNAYKTIG